MSHEWLTQGQIYNARYQIIGRIASSDTSEVYRALVIPTKEIVVLKILQEKFRDDVSRRQKMEKEAELQKRLNHKHIIKVIDSGYIDARPFLALPYYPKSLPWSKLSLDDILFYLSQITDALEYLHTREHLVHWDINPNNLLLTDKGEVIVIDLGTARKTNSVDPVSEEGAGTPAFMAPEQWEGKATPQGDEYALATCVYLWLTGETPFSGNLAQLFSAHRTMTPPSFKEKGVAVHPAIEAVVMKGLEKDPEKRYKSVREFSQSLEEAIAQSKKPPQLAPPSIKPAEKVISPPSKKPPIIPETKPALAPPPQKPIPPIPLPPRGIPAPPSAPPQQRLPPSVPTRQPISPQTPPRPGRKGEIGIVIGVVIIVVLFIVGGVYIVQSVYPKPAPQPQPTTVPTPTGKTPTPTQKPTTPTPAPLPPSPTPPQPTATPTTERTHGLTPQHATDLLTDFYNEKGRWAGRFIIQKVILMDIMPQGNGTNALVCATFDRAEMISPEDQQSESTAAFDLFYDGKVWNVIRMNDITPGCTPQTTVTVLPWSPRLPSQQEADNSIRGYYNAQGAYRIGRIQSQSFLAQTGKFFRSCTYYTYTGPATGSESRFFTFHYHNGRWEVIHMNSSSC